MMRFVYFGSDLLTGVFDSLLDAGYLPHRCYVCDDHDSARQLRAECHRRQIPVSTGKPHPDTLSLDMAAGVELFVCAEYPWHIPIPAELRYGVNFHTSLLPRWAGKTPLPYILENNGEGAGITCHYLTNTTDNGPIIDNVAISLSTQDDLSTLMCKIKLTAGPFARGIFEDFENRYAVAKTQQVPVYHPPYPVKKRDVEFRQSVDETRNQIRIFGCYGIIIQSNGKRYSVVGANAVHFDHRQPPGHIIYDDASLLSVTLKDGVLTLPKQGITPL